jgi:polysaccharide biosynthesis/export protein VpsN
MMQLQRIGKCLATFLVVGVVALGFGGCTGKGDQDRGLGSGGTLGPDGMTLPVDPGADQLFNGDRITIVFSGPPNPPPPHMEQIRSDGYISPPLLPDSVQAAGKTIGDLQLELHRLYVPNYYRTLTITVKAEERYFFVGGHVISPGRQPYLSGMTLTKAIQVAGDFTIWASKGNVQITRTDGRTEEHDVNAILRDPRLDPPIYPNDAVYVARRGPISI